MIWGKVFENSTCLINEKCCSHMQYEGFSGPATVADIGSAVSETETLVLQQIHHLGPGETSRRYGPRREVFLGPGQLRRSNGSARAGIE
jgi:hypothetical protein